MNTSSTGSAADRFTRGYKLRPRRGRDTFRGGAGIHREGRNLWADDSLIRALRVIRGGLVPGIPART